MAVKEIVNSLSEALDVDIHLYSGQISREGYEQLSVILRDEAAHPRAILMLSTVGGDPHAGYRIARALCHHYPEGFSVMIPGLCKSAGTLICLGAKALIMGDRSELGPLDVQVRKKDELFELGSGLDTIQALSYMQSQAMSAFRTYLIELKADAGLSTRMAAEISTKLATGLFSPVYSQVDPVRLGELQRSIEVAYSYGNRLSKKSSNLKSDALNRLVSRYPAHGFVIDRSEARELFENVRSPAGDELDLLNFWYDNPNNDPSGQPMVINLTKLFGDEDDEQQQANVANDGPHEGDGGVDAVEQAIGEDRGNGDPVPIQDAD
ncbi:SDH family Clp fold serine proteinase [Methylovorus glucosotrophus]|uniref:SppA protein n=1 Tax=Methylovorus glucosotrophus (strain SIP3-4) TaxID=582744 RepID=C6XEU4_METGS|nr:SppA protein [Methylovorus glucosotrophus]ACT52151.1 SppA protein [Methylovorus glucosotrophus SIP3-4]